MSYATGISERVTTSDLQRLVDRGLLVPFGERRGRFYVASGRLAELRSDTRSPRTPIPDLFELRSLRLRGDFDTKGRRRSDQSPLPSTARSRSLPVLSVVRGAVDAISGKEL